MASNQNSIVSDTATEWRDFIAAEMRQDYFRRLDRFLRTEARTHRILPDRNLIFRAFDETPLDSVRVCILAMDPYPNPDNACGLAFSVPSGVAQPASLRNIAKEIQTDVGPTRFDSGDLTPWAWQGCLLLNAALTVRSGESGSHARSGWHQFTDAAISLLNGREQPVAFVLWGADARRKAPLITNPAHLVIEGGHPSPLSAHRGFFGGRYFSRVNTFMAANGMAAIDWSTK